ncbi:hypothetical protein WG66_013917 [Moniliophthora roreri]|nr:hypothetical protein WG66_013917 [Moniliophthora roreri]
MGKRQQASEEMERDDHDLRTEIIIERVWREGTGLRILYMKMSRTHIALAYIMHHGRGHHLCHDTGFVEPPAARQAGILSSFKKMEQKTSTSLKLLNDFDLGLSDENHVHLSTSG